MKITNPHKDFTALVVETEKGKFFGIVAEVPGALSQGNTVEELLENLKDAVSCIEEYNKTESNLTMSDVLSKIHVSQSKQQSFALCGS